MPKSRGRRPGRGAKNKPARRTPRPPQRADLLLRDARQLSSCDDPLVAEIWASGWLGQAWINAPLGQREAEHQLCMQVCGRVCTTPTPHGLAAVAALTRAAPATETPMLSGTIDILAETQPPPPWQHTNDPTEWTPVTAWRAVDVWDSEHVLFLDYDGPHPHTLMAQINHTGGVLVDKLAVLQPGAATHWDHLHDQEQVPMPLTTQPVGEVLAELADALRTTDMTWPRNDDEDFVDHRALAWTRCRDHLPDWPEHTEIPDTERDRLIQQFTTSNGHGDEPNQNNENNEVVRSLAELFLDYGQGYIISGPLSWSPDQVMLLLADWLPRKAILDADQRQALPDVLRRWINFALTQRGTDPQWITPVLDAVDTYLPEFHAAFDDDTAWGPAKHIAAALTERGIDLTNRQAVDDAIRALNAEQLAQRLLE
jgi:hypothetical protein